jgi:hypothetical protein
MLSQLIRFISGELSTGNFLQNIGFYTSLILLAWVIKVQFKQKAERFRVN